MWGFVNRHCDLPYNQSCILKITMFWIALYMPKRSRNCIGVRSCMYWNDCHCLIKKKERGCYNVTAVFCYWWAKLYAAASWRRQTAFPFFLCSFEVSTCGFSTPPPLSHLWECRVLCLRLGFHCGTTCERTSLAPNAYQSLSISLPFCNTLCQICFYVQHTLWGRLLGFFTFSCLFCKLLSEQ